MAAHMLHAVYDPLSDDYIGTATIGSSEAVMLGILAHKTRWFEECGKLKGDRILNDIYAVFAVSTTIKE